MFMFVVLLGLICVGLTVLMCISLVGNVVNIRDAYKHPKFFKDIDKTTGFRTKYVLFQDTMHLQVELGCQGSKSVVII